MSAESRSLEPVCFDCGLSYESSRWADLVVSNEVWAQIAPFEGNGLLCANCMVGRCTRLGIKDPTAKFTSGPFATNSDAGLKSEATRSDDPTAEDKIASLTQQLESLRASLANEKEAREKLEFELAARDVNDPALDEAIDKMQEGFKILQQHKSKRRKTT
jgi:septal ring factor EnvC (AmiA/AmiB activator)